MADTSGSKRYFQNIRLDNGCASFLSFRKKYSKEQLIQHLKFHRETLYKQNIYDKAR